MKHSNFSIGLNWFEGGRSVTGQNSLFAIQKVNSSYNIALRYQADKLVIAGVDELRIIQQKV